MNYSKFKIELAGLKTEGERVVKSKNGGLIFFNIEKLFLGKC